MQLPEDFAQLAADDRHRCSVGGVTLLTNFTKRVA
jgi:hypothetical protein